MSDDLSCYLTTYRITPIIIDPHRCYSSSSRKKSAVQIICHWTSWQPIRCRWSLRALRDCSLVTHVTSQSAAAQQWWWWENHVNYRLIRQRCCFCCCCSCRHDWGWRHAVKSVVVATAAEKCRSSVTWHRVLQLAFKCVFTPNTFSNRRRLGLCRRPHLGSLRRSLKVQTGALKMQDQKNARLENDRLENGLILFWRHRYTARIAMPVTHLGHSLTLLNRSYF